MVYPAGRNQAIGTEETSLWTESSYGKKDNALSSETPRATAYRIVQKITERFDHKTKKFSDTKKAEFTLTTRVIFRQKDRLSRVKNITDEVRSLANTPEYDRYALAVTDALLLRTPSSSRSEEDGACSLCPSCSHSGGNRNNPLEGIQCNNEGGLIIVGAIVAITACFFIPYCTYQVYLEARNCTFDACEWCEAPCRQGPCYELVIRCSARSLF